MSKPIIAIVGRPNVGKSMLFNKIIGRRLSIVEDTPGVTRDRIYGESDWQGRKFTLIDTGGIEPRTDNQILAFMRSQAQIAIDNATVIVFLCDIKTGMKIVLRALEEPVRQIALNAGMEGSVIIDKIRSANKENYGYDFAKGEYTDMFKAGIVDPTKVTRSALQNAASVAAMILTTESLVADKKEPAAPAAAPAGGMDGMY